MRRAKGFDDYSSRVGGNDSKLNLNLINDVESRNGMDNNFKTFIIESGLNSRELSPTMKGKTGAQADFGQRYTLDAMRKNNTPTLSSNVDIKRVEKTIKEARKL